jgi:uncharacterized protein
LTLLFLFVLPMKTLETRILVSPQSGEVTGEIYEPSSMSALLVLAHGAGAGMKHPFMATLAQVLAERQVGTLRFNFPYMEQKKKRPDFPAVAEKAVEAAIQKAKELYPTVTLFAGGKSFGGRMTSQYMSKQSSHELVRGLVFFGFPLHPAGKPSIDRAAHLKEVVAPMLFLQGTKDSLAEATLIEPVCSELATAELQWIDRADHAFYVPGRKDVVQELGDRFASWAKTLIAK